MSGGSRVDDAACVICGMLLIDPANSPLSMCTDCFKATEKATKKQIGNMKNRKGMVKSFTIKVPPELIADRLRK